MIKAVKWVAEGIIYSPNADICKQSAYIHVIADRVQTQIVITW